MKGPFSSLSNDSKVGSSMPSRPCTEIIAKKYHQVALKQRDIFKPFINKIYKDDFVVVDFSPTVC